MFCRAAGQEERQAVRCLLRSELNIKTESPVEKMAIKPGVGLSPQSRQSRPQSRTQLVTERAVHCFVFNYNYRLSQTQVLSEIAISSPEIN